MKPSRIAVGLVFGCLGIVYCSAQVASSGQVGQPAKFVAEHASDITWSPDGRYLGYDYMGSKGADSEVGLYDLRAGLGKPVLRLKPNQKLDRLRWLNADGIELALVSEPTTSDNKPATRETVYALYSNNFTARKIWTADVPNDQNPSFSIEESPSLSHAIITAQTTQGKTYFVVALGAGDMVVCTDIRDAIKSGKGFAGWTVNGTAFFGGGATDDLGDSNLDILGSLINSETGNGSNSQAQIQAIRLEDSQLQNVVTSLVVSYTVLKTKPNIPTGTAGYELMPDAAVLRPIEFPGYWVEPQKPPVATALTARDQSLVFKDSTGGTRSLWLTPNVKAPTKATLVSPQAEQAWLHPNGHTVAFIMNGVLFVRTVGDPI